MTHLREMKKTILVPYKNIRDMSILYLLFPFLLFLLTWIKAQISIPCLILLGILWRMVPGKTDMHHTIKIRMTGILLILFVSCLWCFSAGIGGFFYQSPDHNFRNAVFRDLVFERWPVIYESYGTGMVYYLGIWIVPAFLGKILLWMGMPQEIVWTASGAALLLWCSIGVVLLTLLMCLYFRQSTVYGISILMFIMIGFSGLDIVGEVWKNGLEIHDHIEWWSGYFQFRSNTTSIFWAYNQAIPCWLMTMLLLSETDFKNYGMILGSTLFYAPFAVAGMCLCVVARVFQISFNGWKGGKWKEVIYGLFSYTNIAAAFIILPIMAAFYACNAGTNLNVRFCWEDYGSLTQEIVWTWICFFFLEAGVYICLVAKNEYKNPLAYAVVLSLAAGSVIAIGQTGEVVFQISATMPALFILMCFVMKIIFIPKKETGRADSVYYIAVSVILAIGIVTPAVEYGRAIETIVKRGAIDVVADDLKTLNTENAPHNFIGSDISDSFFYLIGNFDSAKH